MRRACYALGVTPRIEEWLHQGEYDRAYDALVAAAERRFTTSARAAEALVDLAEFYSLYGEAEAEAWRAALDEAGARWPGVERNERYAALRFELEALAGQTLEPPPVEQPRAAYHVAQGLAYLGRMEAALEALPDPEVLPPFLEARAWALSGRVHESLGHLDAAARAHERAAGRSHGKERLWSLLDAAALWLETEAAEQAQTLLTEAEPLLGEGELSDRATYRYLRARVELLLGNPERAAEEIVQAEGLEAAGAGLSHGTAMVRAQVHQRFGRLEAARAAYQDAEKRAAAGDLPFVWHEWGLFELDHGDLIRAEALLRKVASDEAYPHRAHALADLAEAYYRLGDGAAADDAARRALELGTVPAAHLILGNRAYDVGAWDEALAHYRAAAAAAREGDRDWVTATEMIVDVLAQTGYPNPAEVAELAERLLPYLPPSDEWRETLRGYADRARELALKGRLLN